VDGETGLLVPPRDHHALARAIATLLKDHQRREQMGAAGLERVQRMFSAERMVEKTLEVYRNLSAGSARPAAHG
jgi:glycosyltransferase involved in cell wall biosynthesis